MENKVQAAYECLRLFSITLRILSPATKEEDVVRFGLLLLSDEKSEIRSDVPSRERGLCGDPFMTQACWWRSG